MKPSLIHILLVVGIIVILFGASRLPGVARNLGKSMKIMRDEVRDLRDDAPADAPVDATPASVPPATPQAPRNPTDLPPGSTGR